MNNAPCKDCPDRLVGCHSTCEKYITFAKEKRQQNEIIKKAKHEESLFYSPHNRYKRNKMRAEKYNKY